jgi:hypothetical protein
MIMNVIFKGPILTRLHDGCSFYFTKEAFENEKVDIIGFYFDDNGNPQSIHRTSIYGEHIKRWIKELGYL